MSGEIEVKARGHLAADAVTKFVQGEEVVELRLAVGVRRKDGSGEYVDLRTDWLGVTVWGYAAKGASTLCKGQLVVVEGRLKPGAYLSSTGEAAVSLELSCTSVLTVPRLPRVLTAAA